MTNKLTDERVSNAMLIRLIQWADQHNSHYVAAALCELQERRKAAMDSEPVGWTDEQELRSVEKDGCGYLFKANPISPNADPRRVIKLYRHAPPVPVVPEECPEEIRDLMASHSDALFNDDDAQEIWNACRAAMLKGKGE
ncbi:hypothetical protein PZE02_003094 [Salmonella enterica subsp. enterica serovar Vitkin]|uniref:Uncharacterized protein n=1 Tax=Salmonella enterica subsp. enterica serovar Vitkin TaxID=2565162 RepID=A0A5I4ZXE8_SALET|nr:hypothetical protein [Salmonella enterica]EBP3979325.1 hypothetical protein [Salmonella enterica subsp. enterica]EBY0126392.1 hypothetical protein [Salmonella enterica subsp. enterica serovar Vitkin]ECC9461759.1 hypothetical protein [Salmonella enterica subsp. salamae]EIP4340911.1 hypothetical protein [Salmonella enterica subsp. enterica serovar Pomona]EAA9516291.1 hypothetical protein [Salmonella enterica]